jgi:hypothetical protein
VQFSFSDDNTVLSELVEGLVNVIADFVGFVFLPNVTLEDSLIQRQRLSRLNQMQPLG